MTPVQIAAECARLEAAAAAKGYYMPSVTIRINWMFGRELTASLETRVDAHSLSKSIWMGAKYEEGFECLLDKVQRSVDALTSIEDAKRDAFIAAVGRLIDHGREIGVDVAFLNPLTEMMTKLSTNIITKL